LAKTHHDAYLARERISGFPDPINSKMWHFNFDPHSLKDMPDIPLAELRPPPNRPSCLVRGSETVKEFLDRSNIQTAQKSFIH
jgi:hypothetical protein